MPFSYISEKKKGAKLKPEKVIIRREFDKYTGNWGYVCCFPEMKARRGYINFVEIYSYDGGATWRVGCLDEMPLEYFYKRRLVKRGSKESTRVLAALKRKYDEEFIACERR